MKNFDHSKTINLRKDKLYCKVGKTIEPFTYDLVSSPGFNNSFIGYSSLNIKGNNNVAIGIKNISNNIYINE